jgi:hypothetical protein
MGAAAGLPVEFTGEKAALPAHAADIAAVYQRSAESLREQE